METNFPSVTKQDILNFPFPYKLWLVVNLEYCDFLRWNRDGTVVLLDLITLEDYLNSSRSIFKIKNNSCFLKHLEEFQFERLNLTPEAEEDLLLQYKNENFQRHRLDLVAKIRRHTYHLLGELPMLGTDGNVLEQLIRSSDKEDKRTTIPKRVSDRMLGDLCFMFHGGLSRIKKSRLHFQTILHFNNEKRILKEKLDATESNQSNYKSKTDNGTDDQVIELSAELFENPHDSILNLSQEFPVYAGYYGNCSNDQINNFFGEYLPKYEDGSLEVKKVVADNSTASSNNSLSINTDINVEQSYSPNANGIMISTPLVPNAMYNFNFSSNLEPIFNTNEITDSLNINYSDFTVTHLNPSSLSNDDNINSNSLSKEEDISMEEFLKFKNSDKKIISNDCQQIIIDNSFANCDTYPEQENTKTFPQMPSSFQMELNEEVKENEANFRNFFSQYRASLNLLYERQ